MVFGMMKIETSMRGIVLDYFVDLFHSLGLVGGEELLDLVNQSVTTNMNRALLSDVREEEVRTTLF